MIKKTTDVHQVVTNTFSECPTTKQQVVVNTWRRYPIYGGQLIWWHCPACQGWHGMLAEEKETDRP